MPSPPVPPRVPATYPTPSIVLTSQSLSKSLSLNPTIPNSSTPVGQYGEVVVFDFSAPDNVCTVNIKWLPDSAIAAYITMLRSPGSVAVVTDDAGVVYTGYASSFVRKRLPGTNLNEIDLTIKEVI